jgi:hypothetical protein
MNEIEIDYYYVLGGGFLLVKRKTSIDNCDDK